MLKGKNRGGEGVEKWSVTFVCRAEVEILWQLTTRWWGAKCGLSCRSAPAGRRSLRKVNLK